MRVLALVPGGIDDQLLFLPTLAHLHAALPNAYLAVVAEPQAKEAYRLSTLVDEVIPYSFQTRNSPADWANLLGIVRDREFEAAITLTQSWSIGMLLWLSGIPTRIGYEGGSNGLFLTTCIPLKTEQYLADQYHDLLRGMNILGAPPELTLNIPQSDLNWVEGTKQAINLGDQGYVLVYPGPAKSASGAETDSYPVESWATILKDFQTRQPGLPIVLLQTPEAATTTTSLAQQMSDLKRVQPETIGQMAALIAGANLVLSPDSYPLYLAAGLKVFALGLFGATDPTRQLPPAHGEEVRLLGIASETRRIADISPEAVLKKIWNE